MNKSTIKTLSLTAIVATVSISSAISARSAECHYINQNENEVKKEENAASSIKKADDGKSYFEILRIEDLYKEFRVSKEHIFGLFLEFGEGKLSTHELHEVIQKKIIICQNIKLEKDNGTLGSAIKFVTEVALETWKQAEKNIIKEMRELEQKKINLKSLQSKYRGNAINWFRYEYGESCSDYGMISLNFGGLYGTHGDLKKGWN
jgi:hypothetical protein